MTDDFRCVVFKLRKKWVWFFTGYLYSVSLQPHI
jgi:hypothetical protein